MIVKRVESIIFEVTRVGAWVRWSLIVIKDFGSMYLKNPDSSTRRRSQRIQVQLYLSLCVTNLHRSYHKHSI